MNRFQFTNIDLSITRAERDHALSYNGTFRNRKPGRGPRGRDPYAGRHLEARRDAYNSMSARNKLGYTCPGSMNRKSK